MPTKKTKSFKEKFSLICLLLIIITLSKPSIALDLKEYKGVGIIIQYEPPLENAAKRIAVAYPEIKNSIEKKAWMADKGCSHGCINS